VSDTLLKSQADAFEQSESTRLGLPLEPSGVPAPLASVDAMVTEAQRRWAARGMAGDVGYLFVNHIGSDNSTVSIYRAGTDRIALTGQGIHFDGPSGKVLHEEPPVSAVQGVNEFITGLHLQHFRHWLLRALYFIGGIAGCVCIATGFVFFVEKRKRQHAKQGLAGARWVDAFAVTTVTGMVVATLAILIANRWLPESPQRGEWQEAAFWGAWIAAFLHAVWRTAPVRSARLAPAWAEQSWTIAVLAVVAVLSNWITTGDHLLQTVGAGYWPVAGVDLMLLLAAVIAAVAAKRLHKRAAQTQGADDAERNEVASEAARA
jgi:hypothetical protein